MHKRVAVILIALGFLCGLAGCTQMPTEKQGISDLRPQISFKLNGDEALSARVFLDGLDVGQVGDYVDGQRALRILSGNHTLRVIASSQVLLEERFYIGDGVSRSFLVK